MAKKGYGWVGEIGWDYIPEGWMWPEWRRFMAGAAFDVANWGYLVLYMGQLGVRGTIHYHPVKTEILCAVGDGDVVAYIGNAHGNHKAAQVRVYGEESLRWLQVAEVETKMRNRDPMRFAFLIHCGAMDKTGSGSWSDAFRKGQTSGTVVIGITKGEEWEVWQWMAFHILWAKVFYTNVGLGFTFKRAFDEANAYVPAFGSHLVFNGDPSLSKKDLT